MTLAFATIIEKMSETIWTDMMDSYMLLLFLMLQLL